MAVAGNYISISFAVMAALMASGQLDGRIQTQYGFPVKNDGRRMRRSPWPFDWPWETQIPN